MEPPSTDRFAADALKDVPILLLAEAPWRCCRLDDFPNDPRAPVLAPKCSPGLASPKCSYMRCLCCSKFNCMWSSMKALKSRFDCSKLSSMSCFVVLRSSVSIYFSRSGSKVSGIGSAAPVAWELKASRSRRVAPRGTPDAASKYWLYDLISCFLNPSFNRIAYAVVSPGRAVLEEVLVLPNPLIRLEISPRPS